MFSIRIICVFSLVIAAISSLPVTVEKNDLPRIVTGATPVATPVKKIPKVVNDSTADESELVREVRPARTVVRPGMSVTRYAINIVPNINGRTFEGVALIQVNVNQATLEDDIIFHVDGLNINSVEFAYAGASNFVPVSFSYDDDDGLLEISTDAEASSNSLRITYTGSLDIVGDGLFVGSYEDSTYLAMNLHPTHARRVFPCVDEPLEASTISFTFNGLEYSSVFSNSLPEDSNPNQFVALQGPVHLWGMIAHNFNTINIPLAPNVLLYGRPGRSNQDAQASLAINAIFTELSEWTDKSFFDIRLNQDGRLNIVALPDASTDWYSLSVIGLWEPYIFMENIHSSKQKLAAMTEIAKALSRQWFGYVIFPENWRYEWVVSGLGNYAAYEAMKTFQTDPQGFDTSLLDMNTIFVTDVIQESLYHDAYANALPLQLGADIFDEADVRDQVYGLVKHKAPAVLNMLRLALGQNQDFIRNAAQVMLNSRALDTVHDLIFQDALNSNWGATSGQIDNIADFLEPWVLQNGYPVIYVLNLPSGCLVTPDRFGYSDKSPLNYVIPITYTTSVNFNFDNIYPSEIMREGPITLSFALGEEDFPLFNIQGQGYYRVNYVDELWERIIEGLDDPDIRNQIHPLNRATLVDDALNLARGNRLSYEIALQVVLTMEHEFEYAPWKAFIRNMDFLRRRLVALVEDDEDLDPDIYLRMVRRTIGTVESELGFYPDPLLSAVEPAMVSLTRGLVMDHACRAKYIPCMAAAVDWFFDPNSNEPVVNPSIPHDIRPAVYCTMVREGGDDIIAALYARLELEPTTYERVVILESLGCSSDSTFITGLLQETIATNSPYGVEERSRIFKAVVAGSHDNAVIANAFLSLRVPEIRRMYGGSQKLEEIIYYLAEYTADSDLTNDFAIWINNRDNNLDESLEPALRARAQALENLNWNNNLMDEVYDWIDENDAPKLVVSLVVLSVSLFVTLINYY